MIEFCSPVYGGLSIYAVYPQYLMEELDRVQSRSLRIIVLPRNYLTTLTERTNEATPRCLHISYKQFIGHNNPDYNMHIPLSGAERHRNSFIPQVTSKGYLGT